MDVIKNGSVEGTTPRVRLLGLLVEVHTQRTYVFALLHQLVQVLPPLQQVVQVLVANVLHLLQLVLQFLQLVHFLRVLVFFDKLFKLAPFDIFVF